MTWVRIDDRFAQHPKVVQAGPLAMAMQVAALGYCNRELTDGFIPRAIARTLVDCDPDMGITVDCGWIIRRLMEAGIWEEVEGGYRIHDFLEYQPSREEVLALRETRAEAGRRGGLQRAENIKEANEAKAKQTASNVPSKIQANAKQNFNPVPVSHSRNPIPDPEPAPEGADAPSAPAARVREPKFSAVFEHFWREWNRAGTVTKGHGSKQDSYVAWKRLGLDAADADGARQLVYAGLEAWRACGRWRRGYVRDCERWLSKRLYSDEPPVDAEDFPGSARASPVTNGTQPLGFSAAAQRLDRMKRGAAS